MATAKSLPARPDLDYLKKLAKERLPRMRAADAAIRLADAQLDVAREFDFSSWRKLKSHVDVIRAANSSKPEENEIQKFADALVRKDHATASRMLRQMPALANAADAGGRTMLHLAAELNDAKSIGMLLDLGANPEARWYGHTPMSWAATVGNSAAAKILVQRGIEPDLFCAAGFGDTKRVAIFFDNQGHLRPSASRMGSSRYGTDKKLLPCPPLKESEIVADALYIASRHGHADAAKILLAHHPDLTFQAYMSGTPLHWAYFGANPKIVQMLLAAGANASNHDNSFQCTPRGFGIHVAAEWGDLNRVRRQLKSDPTLAAIFDGGMTPLHHVARGGRPAIVKWLLRAGADPNVRDVDGKTAIDVAREKGHEQVIAAINDGT